MAVAEVFNPPPNWPPPPPGWQPPPGWEPDPAWGPPPDGWRLYQRVNPHPFLGSLGVATVIAVVVLVGLYFTVGFTDYQAGGLFTRIALIPGLATALLLRSRQTRWPWWKIALSVLAWAALFAALAQLGDASDPAP